MNGFENLSGQTRGSLIIVSRASLSPLKWAVRCSRCGSSWNEPHASLVQSVAPSCRNSACGRTALPTRSSASIGSIPTAVRSRDAEDAARFARQQQPREIVIPEMTHEQMMQLDTDTLARHLNHIRRRNNVR